MCYILFSSIILEVRIMKNMNKMQVIGQVSQIIPGAAKGTYSLEADLDGDHAHLLKGNNLDSEGGISTVEMDRVVVSVTRNIERYMLQEGDVVVMARGSAIRAGFVTKEVAQQNVIASANFIIIRPNTEAVQGEVITAYLNSVVGQQRLQGLSKGSAIQHIPTSNLRDLEIPIPSMKIQQNISDIFYANKEAYQATLALAEQQKRTAYASMLNMMLDVA